MAILDGILGQAFDPPKKKRKRVRRAVPTGDDALSLDSGDESGSKRPRPGTLDGFLHAAQAIFGDDSEEDTAEQDEAENGQPSAEQAQPEPRAAEQVRPEEKDLKDPAVSPMFSPPASSVKPPEQSPTSSQASDSSSSSSASSQQQLPSQPPTVDVEITGVALFARVRAIVEAGDADTLTKRGAHLAATPVHFGRCAFFARD